MLQRGILPTGLDAGVATRIATLTRAVQLLEGAQNAAASRAAMWSALGIWVGPSSPAASITYAEWLSGKTGHWGWIQT